jgi:hypothetical protein
MLQTIIHRPPLSDSLVKRAGIVTGLTALGLAVLCYRQYRKYERGCPCALTPGVADIPAERA